MVLSLTFSTCSTLRGMLIQKSLHRTGCSASNSIQLLNLGLQAVIWRNEVKQRTPLQAAGHVRAGNQLLEF